MRERRWLARVDRGSAASIPSFARTVTWNGANGPLHRRQAPPRTFPYWEGNQDCPVGWPRL